jgi:L-ribulose-5-phosphate 3-epimerase
MSGNIKARMSGISDEAGASFSRQVDVFRSLGWQHVELRTVGGVHVADLDDEVFSSIAMRLVQNGLRVGALCSRIGSWCRPVSCPFDLDVREIDVLIQRCLETECRLIRVMSYPNDGLAPGEWRDEVFRRMEQLILRAEEHGIVLLHENCSGWASQGLGEALELFETFRSPNLRCLFDFGNSISHRDYSLQWLERLLPWVDHVHVKDGVVEGEGQISFVEPGRGASQLSEGLCMLLSNGYNGLLSIEPHLLHQPHRKQTSDDTALAEAFVSYGRRFEMLLEAANAEHERLESRLCPSEGSL